MENLLKGLRFRNCYQQWQYQIKKYVNDEGSYFEGVSPSNIYALPERKGAFSNDVNAKDYEEFGKVNESGFLQEREENMHDLFSKSTLNVVSLEVQRENEITTRNHQTDSFENDGQNDVDFSDNLGNVLKYVDDSHVTDKTNEETDKKLKPIDPEINSYEKSYESDEILKGNIQVLVLEEKPLITSTTEESYNKSSVLDTERIVLLPELETSNDSVENNSPVDNKHISLQICFENPYRTVCDNTLEASSLAFTKKLQNENDNIKLLNENYEEVSLDDEPSYCTWRKKKYCASSTEFISRISSVECNAILQNCDVEETEQGKYNSHSHSSSLLSVRKICRITPLKIMKSNGKWNISKKM
ncbi:uncharacterized protein LOC118203576 [Stegodyphus dumicola]|uniref:uncharacterized protein LOC118203576 n=1 Tax=Stegodyphus dumicola TaxID=202533 RepID=UPI0015A81B2A|nr:uncharacterized protein LOC118203576 [Stegodyphus dumicola]